MKINRYLNVFFLGLILCSALPTLASEVQREQLDRFEDFAEGEPLSVSLSQPGVLKPGMDPQRLFDLRDLNIWCGAVDARNGDVYVGTGPKGEVFRIGADNKPVSLAKFAQSDIYALALNAKGELFVATSPKGKIYQIINGKPEEYFDTGEEYVWDLVFDKDGNLYAASGRRGKIFKITAKGQGEVYYQSDESNIRCLAFDPQGHLLAGSSGKGLLYRIKGKNQGVVLLQAAYAEITGIVATGDTIYATATGRRAIKPPSMGETKVELKPDDESGDEAKEKNGNDKGPQAMLAALARMASANRRAAATGDKSVLYRLRGDLYPEVVARIDGSVYALCLTADGVLMGTGDNGRLYRYNKDEQVELAGQVAAKDVTGLLSGRNGKILVLTSNLAQGYALGAKATIGTYLSKVFDSSLFANWGRLDVSGSGKWSVQTRSGNTAEPDKSWYDWQDLREGKIQSPAARYLQFRLQLSSGEVRRIEFAYLPKNQPPEISRIEVLDPGIGFKEVSSPLPSSRTVTLDQILKSSGSSSSPSTSSTKQYSILTGQGLRSVVWKAVDPNDDDLQYKVEIREEHQSKWDELAKELDQSVFSWDSSGWADGNYYVRITADDSQSNAGGQSYTVQKISDVFQIDNTPPKITLLKDGPDYVDIRVEDATSLLDSVQISTDAQDYREVQPTDGICDSKVEEYHLKREKGKPLFIRAIDAAGNVSGLRMEAK